MNFTRELILTRGIVATISECDYEAVSKFRWYAVKRQDRFFAARRAGKTTLYLARALLEAKPNQVVKYRNGNTLDNRRENLFVCSRSQLAMTHGLQKNNKSGFVGVSWKRQAKPAGKWHAAIFVNQKAIYLGDFDDIIEAVYGYDSAAVELHGEFARPNLGVFGTVCPVLPR